MMTFVVLFIMTVLSILNTQHCLLGHDQYYKRRNFQGNITNDHYSSDFFFIERWRHISDIERKHIYHI